MADIELVIKIPEEIYKDIMIHNRELRESGKSAYYFEGLIQNGTPLPKSHGDLIDRDELLKNDVGRIMGFRECDIRNAHVVIEADIERSSK